MLPRHRHHAAYATIVLEGGYVERAVTGRWRVEPGHVITHEAFASHDNLVMTRTMVLNLPVGRLDDLPPVFTVEEPDLLISLARRGSPDTQFLLRPASVITPSSNDWQDRLAKRLREGPTRLSAWAVENGLAASTVSRGFRSAYGITPALYGAEARTLSALNRLTNGDETLVEVAMKCGFADQAHLSRSVKMLTGKAPRRLRQVNSVQDAQEPTG